MCVARHRHDSKVQDHSQNLQCYGWVIQISLGRVEHFRINRWSIRLGESIVCDERFRSCAFTFSRSCRASGAVSVLSVHSSLRPEDVSWLGHAWLVGTCVGTRRAAGAAWPRDESRLVSSTRLWAVSGESVAWREVRAAGAETGVVPACCVPYSCHAARARSAGAIAHLRRFAKNREFPTAPRPGPAIPGFIFLLAACCVSE
jgi:hypothetical protein